MRFTTPLVAVLLSLAAAIAPAQMPPSYGQQPTPLVVMQAWVRATPPGGTVTAAYVSVRNGGTRPLVILSATSPVARRMSIHESTMSGTGVEMRPRPMITIAPGGMFSMKPNGVHLMLEDLKRPLLPGQSVPIVLVLADGETVPVNAVVRPLSAM